MKTETLYSFAKILLEIGAIKLSPKELTEWSGGWKSPVYCDMRIVMSYPQQRNWVRDQILKLIKQQFPLVEAIGGVATGGISMAGILADHMNLPTFYVRTKPKDHGSKRQLEGYLAPKSSVIVIEELISTGQSVSSVIKLLTEHGHRVLGVFSLFTYGFKQSEKRARIWDIPFIAMTNIDVVCDVAVEYGYASLEEVEIIEMFTRDPENWYKNLKK